MSSSNKLPLILFFASLLFRTTLGEIICEELSKEVCAFSISSSGKRCLLENVETKKGVEYQCTTSDVIVGRMAEHIETDACVNACGVHRTAVGISSDSLLEPQFTDKLCSAYCYHNCPNIIDLYFNLAAGEGVYLPDLCEKQKVNPHRAMQVLMNYVHVRAVSSNYEDEDDALSPSSENDGTEADAPAPSDTSDETEEDGPAPSSETAEIEEDVLAPSSKVYETEEDAPAPSSESTENEEDGPAPSSESAENEEDAPAPSSSETAENEEDALAPSSESAENEKAVPSLLSGSAEDEEDAPAPISESEEGEEGAPAPTPASINDEAEENAPAPAIKDYEVEEDAASPNYS
ncbi:hypothetical protein POM88_006693 [Heracleum sosnowskyi]|uniref:PAR1 protein n=1 Tax=Heracleum sosnowskyi TaxID=360622 RepID=A0AAD8J333_9APIA|nr:hypothetical protein POM88_006693 [Heracleum sosnowskyi]